MRQTILNMYAWSWGKKSICKLCQSARVPNYRCLCFANALVHAVLSVCQLYWRFYIHFLFGKKWTLFIWKKKGQNCWIIFINRKIVLDATTAYDQQNIIIDWFSIQQKSTNSSAMYTCFGSKHRYFWEYECLCVFIPSTFFSIMIQGSYDQTNVAVSRFLPVISMPMSQNSSSVPIHTIHILKEKKLSSPYRD